MSNHDETKSVHVGASIPVINRPEAMPIYQTSVFTFGDLDHLNTYFSGKEGTYLYSRNANPNTAALETAVASLEQGEDAVATASGMSAILCGILTFVKAGDHVLCSDEVYGVTGTLLQRELQQLGVESTFVSFCSEQSIETGIHSNTKLLVAEVMTNPLLTVVDIEMAGRVAHAHGAKLLVDNTFTSPYVIKPLLKGADMVVHSATKYLNGHNDVTAGVVIGRKDDLAVTRQKMITTGCNLGPFEAWLVMRGIKTFALRMRQHSANALQVAAFLDSHPAVQKVYHPSLATHETHEVAKRLQLNGFGGMMSFRITDEVKDINRFFRALEMIVIAPSLAGVATTLSSPLLTSHRALTPERQRELGITNGLLRLSVGIEDAADIIADLQQGLDQL